VENIIQEVMFQVLVSIQADRSFIVDYDAGVFLKDGKPFNYVSGNYLTYIAVLINIECSITLLFY